MSTQRPSRMPRIPPPGGSSSAVEQRATLGLSVCSRLGCGRVFQPRRSGGRRQEFCTPRCRRLFNDQSRRQARLRAKAGVRRRLAARSWGWGAEMATGRRVRIAIHPPWLMTACSGPPGGGNDPGEVRAGISISAGDPLTRALDGLSTNPRLKQEDAKK
jgi:hypothetical protein